jgi:hypothetical protein
MNLQQDYNSQRDPLRISEYGRHIQEYVSHIQSLPDKEARTRMASGVVQVMATLNPELRQQANYKEKLWGHLFRIADYNLDVDCPYTIPPLEEVNKKPEPIGYQDSKIKFRFYGRNLQNMVDQVADMEASELKQDLVNLIASFMYNSCKSWNNENLSNEVIAEHLKVLSKGKLTPEGNELVVSADNSIVPMQQQQQNRKFFNKKKNNKFGKNKSNFRRY